MKIGLDIGSTTIKCVVLDDLNEIIYSSYKRHYSHIKDNILVSLKEVLSKNILTGPFSVAISGSAGMGLANMIGVDFIQEVYATKIATNKYLPGTDCVIELGGEDAKILFLTDGMEVRMNGSCAGGTGAFIDQMATLLNITITDLNDVAKSHEKLYSIASRCGVFAKTDIQPLLNQGASKSDVAASIFRAVVNQTIGGLAQGRKIKGNVLYLGGPLTFLTELKTSFDEVLGVNGICPSNSLYFVALGAALCGTSIFEINDLISKIEKYQTDENYSFNTPLFKDEKELETFRERHQKSHLKELDLEGYTGPLYLGIDSGSTTIKFVLIDKDKNLRFSKYLVNQGNPIIILKNEIIALYEKYPNINIVSSAVTGYGEEIVKSAFSLDGGLVETMAHLKAAQHFMPQVDFIIDIGGQDIKCFKIEHGVTSNIFLNEACSSGCGSFLQTFANALGYEIEEFAKLGLMASKPVDLGCRCTVFMNSSVKQAQKDGATIDNISAGLSISVVKNALYKVIRATNVSDLGKHIIVQGGTFYNEAVLRAFERELNLEVICPNISGLMGAFGAALYSMNLKKEKTSLISPEDFKNFRHDIKNVNCRLCTNNCLLTINTFNNENKYISGNRCERPITKKSANHTLNLYEYIRTKLTTDYKPIEGKRGKIGIPLGLNMYELFPFWYTFLTSLGFEVYQSGLSDEKIYLLGQHTIPSDTVCFPAKLVHGHIQKLFNQGFQTIFYPCMSYNLNENLGDNHYNCPVVAYYPELLKNNVDELSKITFITDYVGIHLPTFFEKKIFEIMTAYYPDIKQSEITSACNKAYKAHHDHLEDIREVADNIINNARKDNKQIIVLAGRPYHVDPLISHSIDKLIAGFDKAVITEESISHLSKKVGVNVLNQWTYHARLYAAANYVTTQKDFNLIQLVSFGCGLDAVTTDETKDILEHNNKLYTQIKIDEITNMGAVKIRLRSLFAALEEADDNEE